MGAASVKLNKKGGAYSQFAQTGTSLWLTISARLFHPKTQATPVPFRSADNAANASRRASGPQPHPSFIGVSVALPSVEARGRWREWGRMRGGAEARDGGWWSSRRNLQPYNRLNRWPVTVTTLCSQPIGVPSGRAGCSARISNLDHQESASPDTLGQRAYTHLELSTKDTRVELLQGTLGVLILRTLLPGPAHGHAIAKSIERSSSDVLQVEQGSLYPALHRLIKRGWIVAEDGTSENNRRAKFTG